MIGSNFSKEISRKWAICKNDRKMEGLTRNLIFPYLYRHRHRGRSGDSRHLLVYFIVSSFSRWTFSSFSKAL